MKRYLLLLLLMTLAVQPATAKNLTKVTAVVNNDIISSYQLDKAVLEALASDAKGNQLTSKQFDELKARVLENLINEKLVREDVYTSIHIEEFECGARDTKLGIARTLVHRSGDALGVPERTCDPELRRHIQRQGDPERHQERFELGSHEGSEAITRPAGELSELGGAQRAVVPHPGVDRTRALEQRGGIVGSSHG